MPEKPETFKDELIKCIVNIQPNIKYKELSRMVAELSVAIPRLAELLEGEEANA